MSKQSDLDKKIFAAIKKQWPDATPFAETLAIVGDTIYGWFKPVFVEFEEDGITVEKHEAVYTRWDFETPLTPENVVTALATNEKLYGTMLLDKPMA